MILTGKALYSVMVAEQRGYWGMGGITLPYDLRGVILTGKALYSVMVAE